MMTIINIGLIVLAAIVIAYVIGSSKANKYAEATIYDNPRSIENYLKVVHDFMAHEFSMEIHKHFTRIPTEHVSNSNENTPNAVIRRLADPDEFNRIVEAISVAIILKMGGDVRNAFFRVYAKDQTILDRYVSSYVYFRLRHIVTMVMEQHAVARQLNTDVSSKDIQSDIANDVFLGLELNVYKNLDIGEKEEPKK